MPETDQIPQLKAMFGSYPKTAAIKDGSLSSALFRFDIAPIDTAQKGFKQAVNDMAFDVTEIAIVTFLQAFAAGRPLVLLPFVMNGNFHHSSAICRADDPLHPRDLAGKTMAMRAYSQTTPTWVRGILSDEYGVDMRDIRWLNQEGAHVAGYEGPPWTRLIGAETSLEDMLRAGEVDAILAAGLAGKEGLRTLIPDAQAAQQAWYAKHGIVPINHMVAVRRDLAETRPDIIREIYRLLIANKQAAEGAQTTGIELQPYGFDKVRPAVEMVTRFAFEQALIPENYPASEVFGPVLDALA